MKIVLSQREVGQILADHMWTQPPFDRADKEKKSMYVLYVVRDGDLVVEFSLITKAEDSK